MHEPERHLSALAPRVGPGLTRRGNGFEALPVGQGSERGVRREHVVQVGRTRARQSGDDDGRRELDLVDLGVPSKQVDEQEPVLQKLTDLDVQTDRARGRQVGNGAEGTEQNLESVAVVARAEVGQAGRRGRLFVEAGNVEI